MWGCSLDGCFAADASGGWAANMLTPVCWPSCQNALTALSALTNDVIDGQNKRAHMSTHAHTQSSTHSHVRVVWVRPAPDAGYGVSEPSSCGSWRCILRHGSLVSNGRVHSPHTPTHTHSKKIYKGVSGGGRRGWFWMGGHFMDPLVVYRSSCSPLTSGPGGLKDEVQKNALVSYQVFLFIFLLLVYTIAIET